LTYVKQLIGTAENTNVVAIEKLPFEYTNINVNHDVPLLFVLQIRHRFGCYDEITEVDRRRVRHCNWVRFLRATSTYSDEVNLIGTKVKGESKLNI
jgi:hypothetical protein